MAPTRQHDQSPSSDELNMSGAYVVSSPSKRRVQTPNRTPAPRHATLDFGQTGLRGPSPAKSMIYDTGAVTGQSPWRIKVTVQAEPHGSQQFAQTNENYSEGFEDDMEVKKEPRTPSKHTAAQSRTRTTKVPLKEAAATPTNPRTTRTRRPIGDPNYDSVQEDPDWSPTPKRRQRAPTPAAAALKERRGTPAAKRPPQMAVSARSKRLDSALPNRVYHDHREAGALDENSQWPHQSEIAVPVKRGRGRPRKSAASVIPSGGVKDAQPVKKKRGRPRKSHPVNEVTEQPESATDDAIVEAREGSVNSFTSIVDEDGTIVDEVFSNDDEQSLPRHHDNNNNNNNNNRSPTPTSRQSTNFNRLSPSQDPSITSTHPIFTNSSSPLQNFSQPSHSTKLTSISDSSSTTQRQKRGLFAASRRSSATSEQSHSSLWADSRATEQREVDAQILSSVDHLPLSQAQPSFSFSDFLSSDSFGDVDIGGDTTQVLPSNGQLNSLSSSFSTGRSNGTSSSVSKGLPNGLSNAMPSRDSNLPKGSDSHHSDVADASHMTDEQIARSMDMTLVSPSSLKNILASSQNQGKGTTPALTSQAAVNSGDSSELRSVYRTRQSTAKAANRLASARSQLIRSGKVTPDSISPPNRTISKASTRLGATGVKRSAPQLDDDHDRETSPSKRRSLSTEAENSEDSDDESSDDENVIPFKMPETTTKRIAKQHAKAPSSGPISQSIESATDTRNDGATLRGPFGPPRPWPQFTSVSTDSSTRPGDPLKPDQVAQQFRQGLARYQETQRLARTQQGPQFAAPAKSDENGQIDEDDETDENSLPESSSPAVAKVKGDVRDRVTDLLDGMDLPMSSDEPKSSPNTGNGGAIPGLTLPDPPRSMNQNDYLYPKSRQKASRAERASRLPQYMRHSPEQQSPLRFSSRFSPAFDAQEDEEYMMSGALQPEEDDEEEDEMEMEDVDVGLDDSVEANDGEVDDTGVDKSIDPTLHTEKRPAGLTTAFLEDVDDDEEPVRRTGIEDPDTEPRDDIPHADSLAVTTQPPVTSVNAGTQAGDSTIHGTHVLDASHQTSTKADFNASITNTRRRSAEELTNDAPSKRPRVASAAPSSDSQPRKILVSKAPSSLQKQALRKPYRHRDSGKYEKTFTSQYPVYDNEEPAVEADGGYANAAEEGRASQRSAQQPRNSFLHRALGWLPSFVPSFTFRSATQITFPPPNPTHPILQELMRSHGLPLLPKVLPWTETHFKALTIIFQAYIHNNSAFSPTLPHNVSLLAKREFSLFSPPTFSRREWRALTGMHFANRGYVAQMNGPLIVVCALFEQLLQLDGHAEYEAMYGQPVELGNVGLDPATNGVRGWLRGNLIDEFEILGRLWVILVSVKLNEDRSKGLAPPTMGRSEEVLHWRYDGGWIWYGGILPIAAFG